MTQTILIVGAGFAGLWSALAAARLLDRAGTADDSVEIALIAPEPSLHLRPRLHEADPVQMTTPLGPLLAAAGVRFIQGRVTTIDTSAGRVSAIDAGGAAFDVGYDRLVLASGSELFRPDLPGLRQHAHSIDQWGEACALDDHLKRLASLPATPARNTVVVVGGGFTGVEIACELPGRLRAAWGEDVEAKVIVLERADVIGPDLGPGPRPTIETALTALGIDWRVGAAAATIDAEGLTTEAGERIDALTVIWTAGLRASPLTAQIGAERDASGRLLTDADLRVRGLANVFATGDVALAETDEEGHAAMMSCQHALMMGRFAGHNVAADLIGQPTIPYRQARYGTCLDLGGWGAVVSEGWERKVVLSGAEAKGYKRMINTQIIYPPAADRAAALAAADPLGAIA